MKTTALFPFALALVAAAPAFAATSSLPQAESNSDILDDVRVILPYGSAETSVVKAPAPVATLDSDRPIFTLDLSSWVPSNLTLDSQLSNASAFQTGVLPFVEGSYTSSPLLKGRAGTLALRGGVGFLSVTRTGTVQIPGAPQSYSQSAFLIPVDVGVEARPSFLQWRKIGLYFDAGILPTLMLTERSPFDDGRTIFGLPARFLVGGTYDVRGLLPINVPTYFDLGVSTTVGSVSEGSMNGTGILAGVRVAM